MKFDFQPESTVMKCSLCGYCEIACPLFITYRDNVLGPRWRVQGALMLKNKELNPTDRIEKSLYTCLTCASCVDKCPLNLNIPEIVIEGRSLSTKPPQNEIIKKNILKHGNPFGVKNSFKSKKESKTLLFVGCLYPSINQIILGLDLITRFDFLFRLFQRFPLFWKKMDGIVKITRLLEVLGYEFTFLEREPCCGEILYNMGYLEDFKNYIQGVHEILKKKRIERIISLSPFCAYAFKKLYPKFIDDWDIEVLTLVEAINLKFDRGELSLRVTYHDPCYYARHLGITEEPREILKKIEGLELIEPEHHGKKTLCVGDGGLELYYPKVAYEVAKRRVRELLSTGAPIIVTQCPACMAMIKWVLKREGWRAEVKDIGEIVLKSLRSTK